MAITAMWALSALSHYSMASNYNRVPGFPPVMLKGGSSYVAVRRETYEDMLLCDR